MSHFSLPPFNAISTGISLPAVSITPATVSSMSTDHPKQALTSDTLMRSERTLILEELLKRLDASSKALGLGGKSDRIKELMEKLMNGTISESELIELRRALDVPPDVLRKSLPDENGSEPSAGEGGNAQKV